MAAESVDEVLGAIADEHRPIVDALRVLIKKHAPSLGESIKWGNFTYHSLEKTSVNAAAIVVHKKHVNFQLWSGAHFDDPAGVLEGTGKDMRHVKLASKDDVSADVLAPLIEQAADSIA